MISKNKILPDWTVRSVESEINLSKAYGGLVKEYSNFIHIMNPHVPWNGDFSRAVNVSAETIHELEIVIDRVKRIHQENNLDIPNRYDLAPAVKVDDVWNDHFRYREMVMQDAIFMQAESEGTESHPPLYAPTAEEYSDWYQTKMERRDYYTEEWFFINRPLQSSFISVFKPYWFMKDSEIVGSVYMAGFGDYARLFEVEIEEKYRGQGLGLNMMAAVKEKANKLGHKYILLETSGNLPKFYEKCGFQECLRNKILWQK